MTLSILTPAIPGRFTQLDKLCQELQRQIGVLPVEHLVFVDNKRRTVGEKRDSLLRIARGKYVAYVDDDDAVRPDYVARLVDAADSDPDVITFNQHCVVNGQVGTVEFRLGSQNEPFTPGGITRRNAWHICAWRRTLAIMSHFPATNYGEDWAFAGPLCQLPNLRELHMDDCLHEYHHDISTTAAPPPL